MVNHPALIDLDHRLDETSAKVTTILRLDDSALDVERIVSFGSYGVVHEDGDILPTAASRTLAVALVVRRG